MAALGWLINLDFAASGAGGAAAEFSRSRVTVPYMSACLSIFVEMMLFWILSV